MADADRAAGRTDPLTEKAGTGTATATGAFTNPSTASTMTTKSSATAPTEASAESHTKSSTDADKSKDAFSAARESNVFGEIMGMGGSCFVSVADATTVHKGYEIWVNGRCQSRHVKPCEEDLLREATMYEHMGPHPNILGYYGRDEIRPGMHALRLERSTLGCVRDAIVTAKREPDGTITFTPKPGPSFRTRLRMALDIAQAVQHAHAKGVRHCDLTCRNFLLFDDLSSSFADSGDPPYEYRVKICDWGGAMIEGHDAFGTGTTFEEMRYELPCRGRELGDRPVLPRQIFALGSAVYEVLTWRRPFTGKTDDEVEKLYAREEFDSLEDESIPPAVAGAIRDCWHEKTDSVDDMVRVLGEELLSAQPLSS